MVNICFICKDYEEELYKICGCMDSTLCHNCIILCDRRNMVNCPICRRPLKITTSRDKTKTLFLFLKFIFLNLGLFISPLIYPLYSLINQVSNFSLMYFIISLFSIIIFEPKILKKTTQVIGIKYYKYIITKIIFIILLVGITFLFNLKERDDFYFIIVILPLFIVPSVIMSLLLIIKNIKKNINYINEKTIVKHLIFHKINNT